MDLSKIVQGSPEWHQWRKGGIGASESAAILGVSPYSTPYQVWLEKTGRVKGFEGNFATERGNDLEGKARAKYELLTMEDMPAALAQHPKFEILRASLDGLRSDNKLILEIKCPGAESHKMAIEGKVPEHYMIQIQHQLAVTGADACHYFSYSYKDQSHALIEVLPDVEMQGKIVASALEFWNLVQSDRSPPLTDADAKEVWDDEVRELCFRLLNFQGTLSKTEIDFLKAKVIQLGGHSKIRCGRVLVSKSVTKTGKDSYRLTISKEKELESAS